MQYMITSTPKDGASASDIAKTAKKFQAWKPPNGLTVEGVWISASGTGYMLANTDDYALLCEVVAGFSAFHTHNVDPVAPAQDTVPALQRGLDWATS